MRTALQFRPKGNREMDFLGAEKVTPNCAWGGDILSERVESVDTYVVKYLKLRTLLPHARKCQ